MKIFTRIRTLDSWIKGIEIISGIATVIMLIFIMVQLNQVERSIKTDTNGQLYAHELQLYEILLTDTNYIKIIFEGAIIDTADQQYRKASVVVALFSDFLEHVAIQEENLDEEVWNAWRNWIKHIFKNNKMVAEHFIYNPEFYSPTINRLVKEARFE